MNETELTSTETTYEDDATLYDGWGDDSDTADMTNQSEEAEVESEPAAETESAEQADATTESETEEAQTTEPFLMLKHLGNEQAVTKEEATALAQKGLDYDRIRAKLDEANSWRTENQAAIDLVEKYAKLNNMTVAEYLDTNRVREIMDTDHVDEATARMKLDIERRETALKQREAELDTQNAEQQEADSQAATEEERIKREVAAFMSDFPDVAPESIPQEVFKTIQQDGVSLSTAYSKWRISELTKQVEAQKSQASAKKRSPGSLTSTNASPKNDPIFDGWDD